MHLSRQGRTAKAGMQGHIARRGGCAQYRGTGDREEASFVDRRAPVGFGCFKGREFHSKLPCVACPAKPAIGAEVFRLRELGAPVVCLVCSN